MLRPAANAKSMYCASFSRFQWVINSSYFFISLILLLKATCVKDWAISHIFKTLKMKMKKKRIKMILERDPSLLHVLYKLGMAFFSVTLNSNL